MLIFLPSLFNVEPCKLTRPFSSEVAKTDNCDDENDEDPVTAEFSVYLTQPPNIRRLLFQYPDRPHQFPFNSRTNQKPSELRIKPNTGVVEVDIPLNTDVNYDETKGAAYGEAMKKSKVLKGGGSYGMAGGFSESVGGAVKDEEREDGEMQEGALLAVQTLGGRILPSKGGDPLYMLGAFRRGICFLVLILLGRC